MKIAIGSDHAGFELKEQLIAYLTEKKIEVNNKGCYSLDRADYPDFGHPVAEMVEANESMLGIVICGSGNGINMTVNKHKGIRSALCWNTDLTILARQHNNANIVALPARFISTELALEMVNAFLTTPFDGGRHQNRIDKIPC